MEGMGKVVILIMTIVLGVGVLMSIGTDMLYTQQSTPTVVQKNISVTSFNQTISLSHQSLVVGSETIINNTCDSTAASTCGSSGANLSQLRSGSEYQLHAPSGAVKFFNRTGQFNITYQYYPPAYVTGLSKTIYEGILPIMAVGVLVWIAMLSWKTSE